MVNSTSIVLQLFVNPNSLSFPGFMREKFGAESRTPNIYPNTPILSRILPHFNTNCLDCLLAPQRSLHIMISKTKNDTIALSIDASRVGYRRGNRKLSL
jgi:hypothetical protein